MTVDEELNQLDDNVRRLKIEYDIFFGGGSKKPPTDLEWRVQSLLKKHSDGRMLNFAQRFRFNTVQQKYAVYNSLWQQKLRIKEEGYRRPQDALLAIQGLRAVEDSAETHSQATAGKAELFRIACSDPEIQRDRVRALYEAMVRARQQTKTKTKTGSFDSFEAFVKRKTEQLKSEYRAREVEYAIEMEEGQIRLRARARA